MMFYTCLDLPLTFSLLNSLPNYVIFIFLLEAHTPINLHTWSITSSYPYQSVPSTSTSAQPSHSMVIPPSLIIPQSSLDQVHEPSSYPTQPKLPSTHPHIPMSFTGTSLMCTLVKTHSINELYNQTNIVSSRPSQSNKNPSP